MIEDIAICIVGICLSISWFWYFVITSEHNPRKSRRTQDEENQD